MGKTKDFREILRKRAGKLSVMMAAVAIMFCCFVMQAEAATVKVTGSSVRVRKEASTSSDVVGSVTNGQTFTIEAETTGADGKVWYQITVDGVKGYIRSDLAQKSDGGTTTTAPTVSTEGVTQVMPISAKVTGNQVRVRPDASTNGAVVTIVTKDAVVTINGTAAGADGKTWYLVSFRSDSGDMTGYIREDFLQLAGEITPITETTEPETPTEQPAEVPEEPVKLKDWETMKQDGVWYLVNNTTDPAYQYKVDDVFAAAENNAKLYEGSLKTIKTQKIFIIVLVALLVLGGVGATYVIFKIKDMQDEAYYEEVEKEVAAKRQNKQQNVMHTVGKDAVQKKPTVNGQQRPVTKQNPVGGQPKQMPKQTAAPQPKPGMAQAAGQSKTQQPMGGTRPAGQGKPQQPMQGGQNGARPQQPVQGNRPQQPAGANPAAKPAGQPGSQQPVQGGRPQQPAGANPTAKPAAPAQNVKTQTKPGNKNGQEWKSKNFMTDDEDDFEFEFLNWDGEDEL